MNTGENPSYKTLKAKYVEAVEVNVTHIALSVEDAAGLLNHIEELESRIAFLKPNAVPQLGDVIREVGQEDLTGEIIEIKEGPHELGYLVKLYAPSKFSDSITYYREEFEIMERASK